MATGIVLVAVCLAAVLIFAGAVKLERRAERWEKYERFFHPPDDDDGISVMEDDNADG